MSGGQVRNEEHTGNIHIGLLIAYHNLMEFLGLAYPDFYFNYLSMHYPTRLIAVTELLIALLLVEWLMYKWIIITRK